MSEQVARIVAEHWKAGYMAMIDKDSRYGIGTHPLSLVISALDGETDPEQLGIPEDHPDAQRIRDISA